LNRIVLLRVDDSFNFSQSMLFMAILKMITKSWVNYKSKDEGGMVKQNGGFSSFG